MESFLQKHPQFSPRLMFVGSVAPLIINAEGKRAISDARLHINANDGLLSYILPGRGPLNFERRHAMKAGRISKPTTRFAAISRISITLISL